MGLNRQPSSMSKDRKLPIRFGGKLDLFLRERDITNEGLANMTRISEVEISRIRAGRVAPSVNYFIRIMVALRLWNIKAIVADDFLPGAFL